MSKKNYLTKRKKQHEFDLKREKEDKDKLQAKKSKMKIDDGEMKRKGGKFKAGKKKVKTKLSALAKGKAALVMACFQDLGKYMMSGDKAYVLCFVEFENAKYAFTALEALQDYRFDDRKPDAPVLKIHFARFPFCLPAAEDDKKRHILR